MRLRITFGRWGSPEFIGLGFLSFIAIIITELFGSPFLKNISIIVGLVVGCIVSGAAGYIDGSSIKTAPAITFLWYAFSLNVSVILGTEGLTRFRVKTFKIRVYAPAILPMLAVYGARSACQITVVNHDLTHLFRTRPQFPLLWKLLVISRLRRRCPEFLSTEKSLTHVSKEVYWYVNQVLSVEDLGLNCHGCRVMDLVASSLPSSP